MQDALCAFFYGPSNETFTVPQHWFHLMTSIRQNSQPTVPMSLVHSLAAEAFALDVSPPQLLPELERFLSFFAERGIACRSAADPELYVIDAAVLAWQLAAAVVYHDGGVNHPGQALQSTSRRTHQQAYHRFLSTGHLTPALLSTFAPSPALARHLLPLLIATGILVRRTMFRAPIRILFFENVPNLYRWLRLLPHKEQTNDVIDAKLTGAR